MKLELTNHLMRELHRLDPSAYVTDDVAPGDYICADGSFPAVEVERFLREMRHQPAPEPNATPYSPEDQSLTEMLGIDHSNPLQRLAQEIVADDEDFTASLKKHRTSSGLSTRVVAERMGVDESVVRCFESTSWDAPMSFIRRYLHAVRARVAHTIEQQEEA